MRIVTFILVLLAACVLGSPVKAQSLGLLGVGVPATSGGGGGFQGILDVQGSSNLLACHSLRACSAALRGTKAVNVCDPTNTTCADFLTDATTGDLIFQTLNGTNCATAGTCTVQRIYDQHGNANCDFLQATAATRGTLKASQFGGHPAIFFTLASNQTYTTAGNCVSANQSQPISNSIVAMRVTHHSFGEGLVSYGAGPRPYAYFSATANTAGSFAGGSSFVTTTASDGTVHSLNVVFNGASSHLNIDGTDTAGTLATGGYDAGASTLKLMDPSIGNAMDGYWCEDAVYYVAFSTSQMTAISTNQLAWW